MGDFSQSRGTSALQTGISALCTGNSSPISATRPVAGPNSYRDMKQSIQNGFCCTIPVKSELQDRGLSALQPGPSAINMDILAVSDSSPEANLLATIPTDKG